VNGRSPVGWSLIGQQGFPAITVPAGFTTEVWDREREGQGPRLVGPVAAKPPVGVDFIARPFDEPILLRMPAACVCAPEPAALLAIRILTSLIASGSLLWLVKSAPALEAKKS
jgi:hypothetical protein